MLTRKSIKLPTVASAIPEVAGEDLKGEVVALRKQINALRKEHYEFMRALKEYQDGLNAPDILNITQAKIQNCTLDDSPIGATTASTGKFSTVSASGQITSTLATGTAPLVIASTTKVTNLNVDQLDGADWAAPPAIGSGTPGAGSFTTLTASGVIRGPDGVEATPAYSFTSATGTGVYYGGSSYNISNAGALKFSVTPSGVVVFGQVAATTDIFANTFVPQGSSAPANGLYLPAANSPALAANSAEMFRVSTTGASIGGVVANNRLTLSKSDTNTWGSGTFWNNTFSGITVFNPSSTANAVTGIAFYGGASSNSVAGIAMVQSSANSLGDLVFATGGSGASSTVPERARIASDGEATFTKSVKSTGPTSGIGYATGAGGSQTQVTSKAQGVTLNTICGEVTMHNANLAAATIVSFTLTNSAIAAKDVLVLNHVTTGTRGAYTLNAECAAGSAVIYVRNNTAGILGEAIVIRFAVIKAVIT